MAFRHIGINLPLVKDARLFILLENAAIGVKSHTDDGLDSALSNT